VRATISVVLGTYNEAENIMKLIPLIQRVFQAERLDGEIVVVDDSSPDGTGEVVRRFESDYDNVRLFSRSAKLGHGSAIAEGYRQASGDVIFSMDTDFSHDPADIPRFIAKMNEGFDFVQASRYVRGGSYQVKSFETWKKNVASRLGNVLARVLTGVPLHDFTTSYRAVRREVVEKVVTESAGNSFFLEFAVKAHRNGFKLTEIPIVFKDRVSGKSKLKLGKQSSSMLKELLKLTLS
jgi:dolichol-phosphate mannosyltransferase